MKRTTDADRKPFVTIVKGHKDTLYMRHVDASGKRHTRSTRTTDRRIAERKAWEWEQELVGAGFSVEWSEFERLYLASCNRLAKNTRKKVKSVLKLVSRLCRPKRVSDLDIFTVDSLAIKLAETHSYKSIESILQALKAGLNWAQKYGLVEKAPNFSTTPPEDSGSPSEGPVITETQYRQILAKCDSEPLRRLIEGLWLSGLRISEACKLSWNRREPFSIDATGQDYTIKIAKGADKSKKERVLPLAPDFQDWLRLHPRKIGPVFFGLPRHPSNVGAMVSKASVAANVTDNGQPFTSHSYRRAFGTRWSKVASPELLKDLMRHADIQTTMQFYVNHDAEAVSSQLRALSKQ